MKRFLLAIFIFLGSSNASWAADFSEAEILSNFLSSQGNHEFKEGAKSQGSRFSDLDGDGKPELVLVWTALGPTYWHNNLTVISERDGEYKFISSMQLIGEAKLSSVKDGIIFVDQIIYADKDPICCPTLHKRIQYHWNKSGVFEIDEKGQKYQGSLAFTRNGKRYQFSDLPKFEDYPPEKKAPESSVINYDWLQKNISPWYLRSEKRKKFIQSANYNGHYAVITFGSDCTGCQQNWVVDVFTRKLIGTFTTSLGATYYLDSGLLIADFPPDEITKLEDYGSALGHIVFYKIENNQLKEIGTLNPFKGEK